MGKGLAKMLVPSSSIEHRGGGGGGYVIAKFCLKTAVNSMGPLTGFPIVILVQDIND